MYARVKSESGQAGVYVDVPEFGHVYDVAVGVPTGTIIHEKISGDRYIHLSGSGWGYLPSDAIVPTWQYSCVSDLAWDYDGESQCWERCS